jgi:hypothetical protein
MYPTLILYDPPGVHAPLRARHISTCKYRRPHVYPDYTQAYEKLEFLWAALDARDAEIGAGKRKRDVKTSKSRNLYQCTAERCGIDATTKSGLSQCAGPCLPDIKPSFSSKDCQRTVRFCASNPVRVTDNSVRIGRGTWSYARVIRRNKQKASITSSTKVPDTIHPNNLRNDGKELVTEWPTCDGRTTKVSSIAMTPVFMKEVRGHLEKESGSK